MAPCIPALQGGFASPGPPTLHAPHSFAASFPRPKRLRVIWRRECACARDSRWHGEARVPLSRPSLRRMCRRQGPASHASTHGTFSSNNDGTRFPMPGPPCWRKQRTTIACCPPPQPTRHPTRNLGAAIRVRSRRSPPRLCEAEAPASRMRAAMDVLGKAPQCSNGSERFAHIAFRRADRPKAPCTGGKLPAQDAVHETPGVQGAEPAGGITKSGMAKGQDFLRRSRTRQGSSLPPPLRAIGNEHPAGHQRGPQQQ